MFVLSCIFLGYHPSYGLTGNPSNSNPGGPEPQPPGSNNSVMTSMGIGSPAYGMIPPHGELMKFSQQY